MKAKKIRVEKKAKLQTLDPLGVQPKLSLPEDQIKDQLGLGTSVVFSFDSTGSMRSCIDDVRQKLKDLAKEMFQSIPELKIGIIAHGDYCDNERCVIALDLTNDLGKILDFLHSTPNTSGGDAPECYELALNTAGKLSWPPTGGSLVLIGDATPHGPNYPLNTDHLDWRQELQGLLERGIKVIPMQCLPHHNRGNTFWAEVAKICQTPLVLMQDFAESAMNLGAAVYASASPKHYDTYMRSAPVMRCMSGAGGHLISSNMAKFSAFAEGDTDEVEHLNTMDSPTPLEREDSKLMDEILVDKDFFKEAILHPVVGISMAEKPIEPSWGPATYTTTGEDNPSPSKKWSANIYKAEEWKA